MRYECGISDLKKMKAWGNFEVSVPESRKSIAEVHQSDNMDISEDKGNIEVHTVGNIDTDIYKCITEDIRTDEVIITDNQMQHIFERHPKSYEKVLGHMRDTISNPDYIIRDKHKFSELVIKRLETDEGMIQMVLRICTSEDDPKYKNSIISCWEISERRLQNYLRNKEILYSRE